MYKKHKKKKKMEERKKNTAPAPRCIFCKNTTHQGGEEEGASKIT